MKVDPTAPVHPVPHHNQDGSIQHDVHPGMDIRTEIASRCMAGLLATPQNQANIDTSAELAVDAADAIIKRLNR
jgi:hypothetical protein